MSVLVLIANSTRQILLRQVCVVAVILVAAVVQAQPPEPGAIVQKQTIQQQVQAMTRQLVGTVLDTQMRQLKENRLESHPIYADILQMRKHLDLLVETEMTQVADLLTKASSESEDAQQQALREARQHSRQIVVALLAERQNLLRRLRIAELAAQAQELIRMQSAILVTTRRLPEQPPTRREQLVLTSMEDQRDVVALYQRFKQTLADVAQWPGAVGPEAAEGLRLLDAQHVDRELAQADSHLQATRFVESSVSQEAVIEALKKLLVRIQKIQGIVQGDRNATEEAVRRMIDQQQEIRQATEKADLSQPDADKLIRRQADLHKQIAQLQQKPDLSASARRDLKRAEDSAKAAAAKIFDQNRDEAVTQQDHTVDNLQRAAEASRTAPQLTKPVATTNREQLATQQHELDQAAQSLAKAAADERQVARRSEQAARSRGLDKPQAEQLVQQHAEVQKTAAEVGKKIAQTLPDVAQTIQQAQMPMTQAEAHLKAIRKKPGEASKPSATATAQHADLAAQHLEKATTRVREERQRTADEIARMDADLARTGSDRDQQAAAKPAAKEPKPGDNPSRQQATSGGGIEGPPPGENPTAHGVMPEQAAQAVKGGHKVKAGSDGKPVAVATQDDPWFAQLPPEVRSAIRANAQRTPPRGYEERLQRYFKDIE